MRQMKSLWLGILVLMFLLGSAHADVKWHSSAVGMPYFLSYDYLMITYQGRLENNDSDWQSYMTFPIVSDWWAGLPTDNMPAVHARNDSATNYTCGYYAVNDTGTTTYVNRSLTQSANYVQNTWTSVPTTTSARRFVTCGIAAEDTTRSGVAGLRIYEGGTDHYNDKKSYIGSMCRSPQQESYMYVEDQHIYNLDTSSNGVFCPIISDNAGDLDVKLYVIDENSSTNFSCQVRDFHPTSGSYYYAYAESTNATLGHQVVDFNTIANHYTNGYRGIYCSMPAGNNDLSAIMGYYVDEQD